MTHRTHRGFTLIEALVYLALFSILMGGAIVAAYNLFEAAARGSTRTMLQEETDFLMAKTNWVLSGAKSVTSPSAGAAGSALTVVKWDGSYGNPIVLSVNGGNFVMTKSGGADIILNNTNTTVTRFAVTHDLGSGDGTVPESVTAAIVLSARASDGALLSRAATTTVYIRR